MILEKIAEEKRYEVITRKQALPAQGFAPTGPTRDFAAAIRRPDGALPRIIAEVKKASPSKGVIREDFDPVAIAEEYEAAGAAAVSVLTDVKFFQGDLVYLTTCRAVTSLPTLRKDFIIDEFQIDESRAAGADAVLLIAALLDAYTLRTFRERIEKLEMAALVEVHDEQELEKVIESGAKIIGINNRDLQTFDVDIETTFRLASRIPSGRIIVSESGISTRDDLKRLADAGVNAALIGESLMSAPKPGEKLKELIG